jgi:YfiH family protein
LNYIQPNWPAPAHIKAYTTLRQGWQRRTDEERSSESAQLRSLLSLPEEPLWVHQTHSAIALPAVLENKEQIADATYTAQPNRVCAVLTADCLPLLICNKQGTHVAAIHAGWRGLSSGVIEATLRGLNLPGQDLLVWLGPAIGPQKFEVGADVYNAFTSQHAESAKAFTPHSDGKWMANLYELARIRLTMQGVSAIYGGEYCTHTQEDKFYSYRRDNGQTGRMVSLVFIDQ